MPYENIRKSASNVLNPTSTYGIVMNDYTCTCSCGCQNAADDFVCHNCKIGMCKVGMKK